jgi:PDZ domain-containing protein
VVRTTSAELRRLEVSGRFGLGVGVATANLRFVSGASASTVRVDGGDVGGPSAGLLTALAVYDALVPDDLAAGRHVTGTGTLAVDGTVGRIGGIEEKVRAARSAGADLFLAPAMQVDRAEAAAAGRIRVVGVATFAEAVAALRAG